VRLAEIHKLLPVFAYHRSMASNRIAILQTMVDQNPSEPFARYGLAMEYSKSGNLEEAVREYRALLEHNESYAAAYYHGGQALEKLGRVEEAREMYEKGIEVTTRSGDMKTRNELQAAIDILPL
jgi:tetratricopeptide (TPR) repeat protein